MPKLPDPTPITFELYQESKQTVHHKMDRPSPAPTRVLFIWRGACKTHLTLAVATALAMSLSLPQTTINL
eukprot:4282649-Amphidinium_carterae.1